MLILALAMAAASTTRVRREIRSLDDATRERFFAAMHVMRSVSRDDGQRLYGPEFKTYDDLVLQHFYAAADVRCDQGHFSAGFFTFHRAFVLSFENSLLAVDPTIGAVPYWDFELGWPTDIFGPSEGDPDDLWQVNSGPFANWTLSRADWFNGPPRPLVDGAVARGVPSNPYGFLRGFANLNPAPRLTRSHSQCGAPTGYFAGMPDGALEDCLWRRTYMDFFDCMDFGSDGQNAPHTFAHAWLGGTWGAASNCSMKQLDRAIADAVDGCIKCDQNCTGLPVEDCRCSVNQTACSIANQTNATCQRDAGGDNKPDYALNAPCKQCFACRDDPRLGAAGDFWDGMSSPNEPVFWPHHANMDRAFLTWQLGDGNNASLPYSGFPTQGYCPGHNLHDTISSSNPFYAADGTGVLTHARLLDMTRPDATTPIYTYDKLY